MPYLSFSPHLREEPQVSGRTTTGINGNNELEDVELKQISDAQARFQRVLDGYKDSVVHGSPTLDELYYHFAGDADSKTNRQDLNETQVVTKSLKGDVSKDMHWPLVRVNQLWIWTLGDNESCFDQQKDLFMFLT